MMAGFWAPSPALRLCLSGSDVGIGHMAQQKRYLVAVAAQIKVHLGR